MNGIEPHSYLTGILTAIVNGHKQKDINQLLPWNFKGWSNAYNSKRTAKYYTHFGRVLFPELRDEIAFYLVHKRDVSPETCELLFCKLRCVVHSATKGPLLVASYRGRAIICDGDTRDMSIKFF